MKTRTKVILTVVITAFITFILTVGGIIFAGVYFFVGGTSSDFETKTTLLEKILETRYLYDYDKNDLREKALKAYVEGLDEPYTSYYTPSEFKSYTDSITDSYTGIGVIVSVDDNDRIIVVAPFEGSPAFEAGVEPGDILKSVESVDYPGSKLNDAVDVIRGGKKGTKVNITFIKKDGSEKTVDIERRDISENSVRSEMLDGNIGYIRISQFNTSSSDDAGSTSSEFKTQLAKVQEQGATRLIIDLRDNPGGILKEVVSVADMLLPEGIITYTQDKNGKRVDYKSDAQCTDLPVVILINGNSASASEVLTGALKDHGRATVVGQKSFGKGIVQEVYPLPGGSGISLTTSQYFTPNGVCIHDIGIEPDIAVEMKEEYRNHFASTVEHDEDTQLLKAIEIIKEK